MLVKLEGVRSEIPVVLTSSKALVHGEDISFKFKRGSDKNLAIKMEKILYSDDHVALVILETWPANAEDSNIMPIGIYDNFEAQGHLHLRT